VRLVRAGLRAFALPLVAPLATAHGAIAERAGWLVTLEDETGRFGTGEATPLPSFGGESFADCGAALRRSLARLTDGRARSVDELLAAIATATSVGGAGAGAGGVPDAGGAPCARAALEAAVATLAAAREGRSLGQWIRARAGLPGEPAARVVSQVLIGGASPEAVAAAATRARAAGATAFKLKLAVAPGDAADTLDRDRARVAALRAAVGPAARIRLDANEAWSREAAGRALRTLAPFGIDFVEQPVDRRDLDGLAALARDGAIPVAADEALVDGGAEACLAGAVARIFVVKPAVIGGMTSTIGLAARARAAGIRLVFSNLIEGRVGRAHARSLAAALAPGEGVGRAGSRSDATDEIHGLGTAALLAHDFEPDSADDDGLAAMPCWTFTGSTGASFAAVERFEGGRLVSTGWLASFAGEHADREALVCEGRSTTYRALASAARGAGVSLEAAGLAAGDLVAVLAPPSRDGVVLIHALFERGVVLLPLNARLAEPELQDALVETRAQALVVDRSVDADLAQRLARGAGCALLAFGAGAAALRVERVAAGVASGGAAVEAGRDARPQPADRLGETGAALVLRTSGTSGRPKAAVLGREALRASAVASARLLGSAPHDRWLLCLPLFHIAGLSILVRAALAGACVVLEPRFEAARVASLLDSARISHASFVATTLDALLAARGDRRAAEGLRVVLLGGGPAPAALLERALAAGYPLAPTYGLTEAASQVATRPPAQPGQPAPTDPAGGLVALPGVELRIVDAQGRPLGIGQDGGIEVRGPILMSGYLGDPEATARSLRGGWLATGDVGRLDAEGRLRVLDRRRDLIVSGGENVYPAELESVLASHPDLVDAGVMGVPDARFGARPVAFVVWRSGVPRDSEELAAYCRARLAGYKQPVAFVAVDALPRNASGKLLRRELAALAATEMGADSSRID